MIMRTIRRLRWPLLAACAAALGLAATAALAGNGIGDVFNLGVANTVDATSSLSGNPGANPELRVTDTGATGAGIRGDAQSGSGLVGTSVSGIGASGQSQTGIGVNGLHSATTGTNPGVQGATSSTDPKAAGVVGKNLNGGPGLSAVVKAGAPPLAVNSTGKVANLNSDLLDGIDSDGFTQGKGRIAAARETVPQNDNGKAIIDLPGFGYVWGECQASTATLHFANTSGLAIAVYTDDGSTDPTLDVLPYYPPPFVARTADTPQKAVDRVIYQVGRDTGAARRLATITVMSSSDGANGCSFQADAVSQLP